MSARASWELAEGDEIAQGRTVMRLLGGGRRYEAYLVWDERMLASMVAKVLRPDHGADPVARRELAREGEALARLAHPVLVRGFDVVTENRFYFDRDGMEFHERSGLTDIIKAAGLPLHHEIPYKQMDRW